MVRQIVLSLQTIGSCREKSWSSLRLRFVAGFAWEAGAKAGKRFSETMRGGQRPPGMRMGRPVLSFKISVLHPVFWGPFSSGMLRLAIFAFLDDKRLRKHLFSSGAIDRCGT